MEQCIRQNNAIDIYEDYFEVQDDSTQCERPEAKTVHVFRDPTPTHYKRPISSISWCPDGGSKIAIAYCNLEFQATHPDATKESYIFKVGRCCFGRVILSSDPGLLMLITNLYFKISLICIFFLTLVDDPTEPDLTLHPPSFLVSVEYNPKDPNILAGGCYNGQVIHTFVLM